MTLTKKLIAQSVNQGTGLSFNQAYQLVETTLEIIKSTLAGGEDVLVSGFGKFKVNEKTARRGRNPATGEAMMLKQRKVVMGLLMMTTGHCFRNGRPLILWISGSVNGLKGLRQFRAMRMGSLSSSVL